jgi:hypothetical protein
VRKVPECVARKVNGVIEFWATCDNCRLNTFFGVTFEVPPTAEMLAEAIVAKLGPDGGYIWRSCCSRGLR